jgi:hypothetical protein
LKGLFAAWDADQALGLAKTSTATWSIDVRLGNYVTIDGGSTKATLAARLGADFAHKVSDTGLNYSVPGTGLATYRELRDILQ